MKKIITPFILLSIPLLGLTNLHASHLPQTSCTTWASIGNRNLHKGLIIAKNRDSDAVYEQLKVVHPKQGHAYLGLFYNDTQQKPYPYISAGVNDKGLYIVQNEAASQSNTEGYSNANQSKLLFKILPTYSSVQQILHDQKKLFINSAPNFLIIGDKNQAILVEIGVKKNQYEILEATKNKGILYHTNHYIRPSLVKDNTIFYLDSKLRFNRIKKLMVEEEKPYAFNSSYRWANDQDDGILYGIFREFTVASWIAIMPENGTPFLWVRFTSPKEKYQTFRLHLTKKFWEKTGVVSPNGLSSLKIPGPIPVSKENNNEYTL